jgi:hypothetical protein
MSKIRKLIAILLVVLFLVTVTASAVSAKSVDATSCGHAVAMSTSDLTAKNSAGSNHDYANFVKPGEKPK